MKKTLLVVGLALLLSGCVSMSPRPSVLTSKDMMWIIQKGTTFTATQSSGQKPQAYVADDDLLVLYKGSYMETIHQADLKGFTQADAAKTKGIVLGIIGAVVTVFASLSAKAIFDKVTKKT